MALVCLALIATSVSWASDSMTTGVTVSTGSSLPGGELATVTPLGGSFTTTRGSAETVDGLELFRIDLAIPRFSDIIAIHVLLLNPLDMTGVLGTPNAYLDVAAWYPDPAGDHTLDDGTTVSRDQGSTARMTRADGDAVLLPSTAGVATFYILVRVTVPGGAPPGAQSSGEALRFHAEVRA